MMGKVQKVRTLADCEKSIERCMTGFWEMGEVYRYIRDTEDPESGKSGLYHKTHSTWATYCKERWGLDGNTVVNVIRATEIRKRLAASSDSYPGKSLPTTEKQTRPLSTLPEEEQAPAWKEAVEAAKAKGKEQPSHEDVKKVVAKRTPKPPKKKPTPGDLAHEAAKKMRGYAEGFVTSVTLLMPHMDHLTESEAQGCAYKIAETVHAVMGILEEHGHIQADVAQAVMGNPEDGRIEIVT